MNIYIALLGLLLIGLILAYVVNMLVSACRIKNVWEKAEPEVIREIEKRVRQKIVYSAMLNASESDDFRPSFLLWAAFTADYAVFIVRDAFVHANGEANPLLWKRRESSIKRLNKQYAKLEVKSREASDKLQLYLLVDPNYEVFTQYIGTKS